MNKQIDDKETKTKPELYTLLGVVAPKQKCAVKVVATSEYCPETAIKKINGDYVCCRCYENWKHLEFNNV